MMKPAATTALVGLMLIGAPASAGTLFGKPDRDTSNAVAGTVGIALVSAIGCASIGTLDSAKDLPDDSYARLGWLLGLSGVYAADTGESNLQNTLRNEVGSPVNFSLKDSLGFKSQAGYRCHPRVSAEVDIEWLDGFDGSTFDSTGKTSNINFEPLVVTTSVKAYALTGRYQPYLLAGGGVMTVEIETNDTTGSGASDTETATNIALRVGGGLDFYATPKIVLTLGVDYVIPFGDLEDLDYVSIGWGLRYRF
jgi:opacity protein-like surface antigen